jgi:hypothetical protein
VCRPPSTLKWRASWFTGGASTADFKAAKALLDDHTLNFSNGGLSAAESMSDKTAEEL